MPSIASDGQQIFEHANKYIYIFICIFLLNGISIPISYYIYHKYICQYGSIYALTHSLFKFRLLRTRAVHSAVDWLVGWLVGLLLNLLTYCVHIYPQRWLSLLIFIWMRKWLTMWRRLHNYDSMYVCVSVCIRAYVRVHIYTHTHISIMYRIYFGRNDSNPSAVYFYKEFLCEWKHRKEFNSQQKKATPANTRTERSFISLIEWNSMSNLTFEIDSLLIFFSS